MINENELHALIFLLDEDDKEVLQMVEQKIRSLGVAVIPALEKAWMRQTNVTIQERIENLVHQIQYITAFQNISHWKKNNSTDLLEGLWALATYQYPELDLVQLRASLYQLYSEVWRSFAENMHPYDQIKGINYVFFNTLKFKPNADNFHAVGNSMINIILDSRRSNPIGLCVIYMLIAQRLGLPIYGVNLPNLFILTYKSDTLQFYINVFNRGVIFSKVDIDSYISQIGLQPIEAFYEPCSNIEIIKRMIRNMIVSFEKTRQPEKLNDVRQILNFLDSEE